MGIKGQIRFFNGAILKIIIDPTFEKKGFIGTVELLHEGYTDTVKLNKTYFSATDSEPKLVFTVKRNAKGQQYNSIPFPIMYYKKSQEKCEPMTIFLIRHGEGFHNITKNPLKSMDPNLFDAQLTNKGIEQALKIGDDILARGHFEQYKKTYLYASYLRRSQQTLAGIVNQLVSGNMSLAVGVRQENATKYGISPEIVILDCLNELGAGVENLRSPSASKAPFIEVNASETVENEPKPPMNIQYPLNWNYYNTTSSVGECPDPYTIICRANKVVTATLGGKTKKNRHKNTQRKRKQKIRKSMKKVLRSKK